MSIFRSNNDEIIQENHKNHHKYFMRVRPRQAKVDKKQTVTQSEKNKKAYEIRKSKLVQKNPKSKEEANLKMRQYRRNWTPKKGY